jgi:hypothetical protein
MSRDRKYLGRPGALDADDALTCRSVPQIAINATADGKEPDHEYRSGKRIADARRPRYADGRIDSAILHPGLACRQNRTPTAIRCA